MRMFGFQILRAARHDEIILAQRKARVQLEHTQQEVSSLLRVISQQELQIDALKIKCSRVGVSRLENKLAAIKTAAHDTNGLVRVLSILGDKENEKVHDPELQDAGTKLDVVLQRPLVPDAGQSQGSDNKHAFGADEVGPTPGGASER